MKFVHGATHFFTGRPQLTVKALLNDLKKWEREKLPEEETVVKDIIEYSHAVSCFQTQFGLAYNYMAAMYSKRRKADVLLSIVAITDEKAPEEAIGLYWASQGKFLTAGELYYTNNERNREIVPDFGAIPKDMLPLGADIWKQRWAELRPLEIANVLGTEIGVFLGGPGYEEFLREECVLKSEAKTGRIYKSTGTMGHGYGSFSTQLSQ